MPAKNKLKIRWLTLWSNLRLPRSISSNSKPRQTNSKPIKTCIWPPLATNLLMITQQDPVLQIGSLEPHPKPTTSVVTRTPISAHERRRSTANVTTSITCRLLSSVCPRTSPRTSEWKLWRKSEENGARLPTVLTKFKLGELFSQRPLPTRSQKWSTNSALCEFELRSAGKKVIKMNECTL